MNTTTETKACVQCTHWKLVEGQKGECRRHAPQVIVLKIDGEAEMMSRFPSTAADDWCGDFEQAK